MIKFIKRTFTIGQKSAIDYRELNMRLRGKYVRKGGDTSNTIKDKHSTAN